MNERLSFIFIKLFFYIIIFMYLFFVTYDLFLLGQNLYFNGELFLFFLILIWYLPLFFFLTYYILTQFTEILLELKYREYSNNKYETLNIAKTNLKILTIEVIDKNFQTIIDFNKNEGSKTIRNLNFEDKIYYKLLLGASYQELSKFRKAEKLFDYCIKQKGVQYIGQELNKLGIKHRL